MPLVASTGPVLVRCCQHRPSTGPVLAHTGMFTHMASVSIQSLHLISRWLHLTFLILLYQSIQYGFILVAHFSINNVSLITTEIRSVAYLLMPRSIMTIQHQQVRLKLTDTCDRLLTKGNGKRTRIGRDRKLSIIMLMVRNRISMIDKSFRFLSLDI